jgi:hypothetical protein
MNHAVQETELDLRGIAIAAVAIVLMILLAACAAWFAWTLWRAPGGRDGPNGPLDFGIAGPRLESAPFARRDTYFAEKQQLLHSWAWVDRRAGIARIPVEQAMRLLSERRQPRPGAPGARP